MKSKCVFLVAILTAVLCIGGTVLAACPSADLSGDCVVDLKDLSLLANQWLSTYYEIDLSTMASQWLTDGHTSIPSDMVSIPGGTFQMGDSKGDGHSSELPVHTVTLSSFLTCPLFLYQS